MSGEALSPADLAFFSKPEKPKVTIEDVKAYRAMQEEQARADKKKSRKDLARNIRTWVLLSLGTASIVLALIPPVEPQYVVLGTTLLAVETTARA